MHTQMLPLSAQPPSLLTSKNEFYFKLYYVTRFFYFNCEHFLFVYIKKKNVKDFIKNFVDFQNFQKSNFDGGKFLKIWSSINLLWDNMMSHKKFGPDRFSRFDVYWIQTNKQTNKHPDKPNLYIDKLRLCESG